MSCLGTWGSVVDMSDDNRNAWMRIVSPEPVLAIRREGAEPWLIATEEPDDGPRTAVAVPLPRTGAVAVFALIDAMQRRRVVSWSDGEPST